MTITQRPKGLTAFAVLNFLFAVPILGWAVLYVLLLVPQPEYHSWLLLLGVPILTGALLIASGIGFLRQGFRLGYLTGNAMALGVLVVLAITTVIDRSAVDIADTVGGVYALLLLVLLNSTYKNRFRRGTEQPDGAVTQESAQSAAP